MIKSMRDTDLLLFNDNTYNKVYKVKTNTM